MVFSEYKRNFRPSVFFEKPELMFSYMVVVADSKEEANYLAKPIEMMFYLLEMAQLSLKF